MSAYLCSGDTFDYLATAADVLAPHWCPLQVRVRAGMPDVPALVSDGLLPDGVVNGGNGEQVARILRAQNIRSIQARYPKNWQEMEDSQPYEFCPMTLDGIRVDPVTVLKSVACLDYQSCETEDYHQTLAYAVLRAIEHTAIRALKGYEDAAWGFERPQVADNVPPIERVL